jgi:hypothetical protein
MATPNLSLPAVTEGATNNESQVNDALKIVDGLIAHRVEDRDLTTPPTGVNGKMYIVGASATGDWAGQDGNLAIYDTTNGWQFVAPTGGMQVFIHDEKELNCYSSQESLWFPVQERWSTTEHWTGKYGKSGAKIWSKCLEGITCPNSGTVNTAHGITSVTLTAPIKFQDTFHNGTTASEINYDSGTARIYAELNATNYILKSNVDLSSYTCDVRLEYQKA